MVGKLQEQHLPVWRNFQLKSQLKDIMPVNSQQSTVNSQQSTLFLAIAPQTSLL
ncbi:hypothetical protein QUB56_20440 [Microcoleus sp. AR_TQ3_B6]|uniref:hypothetical protein n=1 Tax=Microcoleus sp. AR_TQ3_B6 TaxID=3055284 RepID=UPI002FD65F5E